MAKNLTLQILNGPSATIPTLDKGEPGFTTDTKKFYIGDGTSNVMINPDHGTMAETDLPKLTLADSAGATTLPVVTATDIKSLIQALRNNAKILFSYFTSGAANLAVKLQTARTIQTSLNSTASASFDGSANITPGVSGTLGVANGGTGVATLTGIVKANGTGAFTAAVAGTDYLAPNSNINCGTWT